MWKLAIQSVKIEWQCLRWIKCRFRPSENYPSRLIFLPGSLHTAVQGPSTCWILSLAHQTLSLRWCLIIKWDRTWIYKPNSYLCHFINLILIYAITQVLFLGSGDLRNALLMASQCSAAYHKLDIHLSDSCASITARSYLFIHLIFSCAFDSSPGSTDCQYLWDLWYSFQWSETTRTRFVKDVRKLLANKMTNSTVIPYGARFNQQLHKILKSWLNTACNMSVPQMKTINEKRLFNI